MNTSPLTWLFLAAFTILSPAFMVWAAGENPLVSDLAGQWRGRSQFTGISYKEATQKKIAPQDVEIVLSISADGRASGRLGGAELNGWAVEANRGWLARLLHIKSDFIIRGQIVGAVIPGSVGGNHPINAPFHVDGTRIVGTVFVIYPIKYPYPFLSLRLSR